MQSISAAAMLQSETQVKTALRVGTGALCLLKSLPVLSFLLNADNNQRSFVTELKASETWGTTLKWF